MNTSATLPVDQRASSAAETTSRLLSGQARRCYHRHGHLEGESALCRRNSLSKAVDTDSP